ncbi:MAG: formylglycine-generating enzyme family protein [Opitutales bacterium]|nr:formylglycine-generating enzyme family protein [Opitutales bacterium]
MKTLILSFCALCVSGLAGFGAVSPEEISDLKYRANKGETAALVALAERCERGEGVPADKTAALCYYLVALKNDPENKNLQQRITSLGGAKFLPGAPGRGVSGEKHVVDLGNGIKIALIKIPAGTFMMGSPKSEQEYFSDEKQTEVKLTEPFALAESEITQAQWCAVMEKNPSFHQGENFPVECVSWHEALAFCRELTRRERASGKLPRGMKFSLPTEAQWEFACRAGTQTRFSFGDFADEISSYGNAASGSETKACAVKSFRPNSWGFFDMHGNVSEWCLDSYSRRLPGGENPLSQSRSASKIHRGGSCDSVPHDCRSANRAGLPATSKNRYLGFRVALVKE